MYSNSDSNFFTVLGGSQSCGEALSYENCDRVFALRKPKRKCTINRMQSILSQRLMNGLQHLPKTLELLDQGHMTRELMPRLTNRRFFLKLLLQRDIAVLKTLV